MKGHTCGDIQGCDKIDRKRYSGGSCRQLGNYMVRRELDLCVEEGLTIEVGDDDGEGPRRGRVVDARVTRRARRVFGFRFNEIHFRSCVRGNRSSRVHGAEIFHGGLAVYIEL